MTPRNFYRELMWSIKDAEIRLVAAVMAEHIGEENLVTLDALCGRVGMSERKVRVILTSLRNDYGIPVCAISGKAGRWLARNKEESKPSQAEHYSRSREEKRNGDAYDICHYPPEEKVEPVAPKLFDDVVDVLAYWRR